MQKNTTSRIRTGTFWYWNSNPTPSGIKRQLKSMKDAGYQCVYIHPMPDSFHKHYFLRGMDVPYLGKQYFRLVRIALEECKKLGLYLMLYDEAGWPSGGVLGRPVEQHPECRAKYLQKDASGHYQEVCDDIPDLMDPRTTGHFIRMVHERYYEELGDEFGKTIRGIFTDEPFWRALPGGDKVRVATKCRNCAGNFTDAALNRRSCPIFSAACRIHRNGRRPGGNISIWGPS